MDRLTCLTTFVMVVDRGGFAAAARHLSIAPATVTQQIQSLEQHIGARLLQRTTRKSTLTEAGQAFYERCVKIIEDIQEASAIANAFHATSKGTLRVNTSPTLAGDVSALVVQYVAIHKETSFNLVTTDRMGGLIDDGIDLAIRDDAISESSLIARRLGYADWRICASACYISKYGLPAHPDDLSHHDCLIYAGVQNIGEWSFVRDGTSRKFRVSGTLRSNDPQALRTAALSGHGLVLLPDAIVSADLRSGCLVEVLSDFSPEPSTIRAVYPSRRQLPLKVRTFVDFASKEFGSPRLGGIRPGVALRTASLNTAHDASRIVQIGNGTVVEPGRSAVTQVSAAS